ncbi:DUF1983 domain-containing protein [Aeromonas caviae]
MAQYALAVSVLSAVASAVSLVISITAQQDPLQPSDSGVQVDKKGQNDPRLVVFGDAYVPLARVYNNANRYDNKWLVQLFSICVGPIKSVQNIYVNGVPYFGESNTNDMTGWHTQGTSGNFPNVSIGLRKGKVLEDPMYTQIIQNSNGSISSEFRGNRSVSLSLLAERWITTGGDNEIRFIAPNNKMAAKVQGLSVIDPRLDPNCLGKNDLSKRVWGNSYQNPACCILTYMLDPFFGLNYDVEDVDVSSFILLANYCDQQNLKFNGFLNQSKTRAEILKSFAESFGGAIYREQGLFRVRPLDKSVSVISLDESNIVGNIKIINGSTDYCNVVKVQFTNTSSNYCEDSYVIPKNLDNDDVIKNKDKKQIEKVINLPFLSDGSNFEAVKFFANRAYKKAQLVKKSISFDIDNTIVKLKYGDVFSISNNEFKFNNKPFRVTAIKNTMDDKQLITSIEAEEYIEEVYNRGDYQSGGSSGVLPPPSLLIPVPSNLTFVQNSGVSQGNGTLSWVSIYEGERRTQVQYRKTGSPTWVDYGLFLMDSCSINNLATGVSYDFRIRTHATIGFSRWVEILNKPINKNINLPAVQNLKGDFSSKDLVITWDPIKGSISNLANPVQGFTDLSQLIGYYQVTIAHDTIGNVKGTFIATSPRFTYTFERNIQNGNSRNIFVSVTPISIYNDTGLVSNGNYTNAPMGQASGVSVTAQVVTFTCRWDNRSDVVPDYMQTNIYIKPTQNEVLNPALHYVGTSVTGSFTQNIEQKSGWVVVEDVDYFGGTIPITASAPLYFVSESIDDLLTDSQFEANVESIENNLTQAQADITKAKTDITKAQADILANASEINTVKTTVSAQGVQITNVQTVANSNAGKIASLETELSATETDLNAKITTNKNAITTTNQAMTSMDTRLTAAVGSNTSAIQTNTNAIATTNQSMTSMDTRLTPAVGSNTSAIQQQGIAISNLDSSLSLYKQENTAEVNGVKSSVTQLSQAQVTTDGKVNSLYTLKVNADGKVAGMSLGATSQGSTVDFLADTFRIASSAGTQSVFEVRGGKTMIKSLLVGDIVASQISADAINGNHIAANSIIQAGSGATSATLNGADANWRIYAGSTTPGSAPFRVSTTGALVATNATITGAITATSGSFSGAITASSGAISGRLTMNGGYIDGRSGQDSINLGSGTFRVDNNGNLYASNGTFGGTIYADKISGDIVNAGLFTFPAASGTVNSGVLHDVFRMNVPAVSWERYMLISLIPLNWRSLENGGRFNMFLRDSTGRNTNIFGENKPMGTIDGYPSLDNFSIRIPANATWVALSIQGDRRQSVGFGQLPIETNWQVFKAGSGGISISVG